MKVLYCTVGGSHQPLLETIDFHSPDHIVFVCSDDDPASGTSGTHKLIEGPGYVCRSSYNSPPDLPNIPTQLGLSQDAYRVIRVAADSPAHILEKLLPELRQDAAHSPVVADYTGGTKSMSAALMMAAVQTDNVTLSLVTGTRAQHTRVQDGDEAVSKIDTTQVRAFWWLDLVEQAWSRYAYDDAVRILKNTGSSAPFLRQLLQLSRGYAAWDRADYAEAYRRLYATPTLVEGKLMGTIALLKKEGLDVYTEACCIYDLYLAALRRAKNGQYDVATLQLYRAFEWIAQWTLYYHHDKIETGKVKKEIVEKYKDLVHENHKGLYVMGSYQAWLLIERLDGPLAPLARATKTSRLTLSEIRNDSMLAHGTTPVSRAQFSQMRTYFEDTILPDFVQVAFKGKVQSKQLPNEFPSNLELTFSLQMPPKKQKAD
ncbi:TIGR02710 family CRISPR-associated CARF protein [Lujinxingia vulgaris]|nr:TIGR02710 family CRISPR-associated CARF protein [Lujinxingia vulgaris]